MLSDVADCRDHHWPIHHLPLCPAPSLSVATPILHSFGLRVSTQEKRRVIEWGCFESVNITLYSSKLTNQYSTSKRSEEYLYRYIITIIEVPEV